MRRIWSIRSKIIALAAVPVAAMVALWVFATVLTIGPAINLLSAQTLVDRLSRPGWALVYEAQKERLVTAAVLANGNADRAALNTQRSATDQAVATFRTNALSGDAQRAASDVLKSHVNETLAILNGLASARAQIDSGQMAAPAARGVYSAITDSMLRAFSSAAAFGDPSVDDEIRALILVGHGQEYLSQADAVLVGAFAAGKLSSDSRTELFEEIGTSRYLLAQAAADLPARDQAEYAQAINSAPAKRLTALEDTLLTSSRAGEALPVSEGAWRQAADSTTTQLLQFQKGPADRLPDVARPVAVSVLGKLAGAGGIGLLAVLASIFISVRIGRSIVGRLARLRLEALEMASERLPRVVRRLQQGENVDVDAETPQLEYGADEVGEVGQAFNQVQRTAVRSAVEEANVRRGFNEVFLNIARRSQTLLHRQLALLDKMERRESEPAELEDLYRVDHLATRMRRHAEDLVILAGAAPGRGWRNPVPMIDVVRGSIGEVEDYKRIDVVSVERSAVLGRAVGDVIHLLAELFENAASFSPPNTRITVAGQRLPNGYAIEIEDRGLGMTAEAIAETNRKLMKPPDFDPSDSARLGLFVVAQLAGRHGIRVSLRASAYGGITSVVLIPGELTAEGSPSSSAPPSPSPEPTPSVVLDDLSADGLVQRRRAPSAPLELQDAGFRPSDLSDLPSPQRRHARSSESGPVADEGLLPRRVRQANMVSQLREPIDVRDEVAAPRAPEEARGRMSSLQQGTNRGRRDAADPRTTAWSEAATASFLPVDPHAAGTLRGRHSENQQMIHRSEKDAK